jgi:hypothetical protein
MLYIAAAADACAADASGAQIDMNTTKFFAGAIFAACALVFISAAAPLLAQQAESMTGKAPRGYVLMPGVMTGPGAIGPIGRRRFCDARSAGLTQLRTDWIARLLKPTEYPISRAPYRGQALDGLAAASGKAIDMFAASCPRRAPRLQTAPAQFEMMEKRIETAAQAVKTVRPAFDAFYASLDDQQKATVAGLARIAS